MEDKIAQEPLPEYGIHYTYEDYVKFSFDEMVEIIKGKLVKMSLAPKTIHQDISGHIFRLVSNYLWLKNCKVYSAPFDVVLPVKGKSKEQSDRVVQPDICVICNLDILDEAGCYGAPDWIIEILSESTKKKDYQDKYDLYEESSVGEYWIVDPLNATIEVFVLENKKYKRIRTYVNDDMVPCHTLQGLVIDMKDVFLQKEK